MTTGSVDTVERAVHKTNEWLAELTREPFIEDRAEAWRVLRAFLQTLRRQLTIDEAAQLGAQLPEMLRGVFYEGLDPSRQPERLDRNDFLSRLEESAGLDGAGEAAAAAAAVTRVLRNRISEGEVDEALSQLPKEIRDVLEGDGGRRAKGSSRNQAAPAGRGA